MKTMAIVQARMMSSRLPGKVMLPLGGAPMLQRLLERLALATSLDSVLVATSDQSHDDVIAQWCAAAGVSCWRGPEHDVLARFMGAAAFEGADQIVRVTADCPLLDPRVVDLVVTELTRGGQAQAVDYVSNMLELSFPYGMAVEAFTASALNLAAAEAVKPDEREHVTPFIYRHPDRFHLRSVRYTSDMSHHRWTVDTPEDYQLVSQLFGALQDQFPDFTLEDVLSVADQHPEWRVINQHVKQKQLGN